MTSENGYPQQGGYERFLEKPNIVTVNQFIIDIIIIFVHRADDEQLPTVLVSDEDIILGKCVEPESDDSFSCFDSDDENNKTENEKQDSQEASHVAQGSICVDLTQKASKGN